MYILDGIIKEVLDQPETKEKLKTLVEKRLVDIPSEVIDHCLKDEATRYLRNLLDDRNSDPAQLLKRALVEALQDKSLTEILKNAAVEQLRNESYARQVFSYVLQDEVRKMAMAAVRTATKSEARRKSMKKAKKSRG